MTIELITGTPGAGKTTYGVSRRLLPESRRKFKDEAGNEYTRRVCVAGVRGLVVEHERLPHKLTGELVSQAEIDEFNRMAKDGQGREEEFPVHQRLPGQPPKADVPCLVQNWWLWVMPGDIIFVDEAQFLAPRGTMGKKPPYWVQALEIHRHYGVDFIIVTQHPQLIDTTIRNLVGLHRHVRPVLGSPLCMVYVWDHASNPERYNLANKEKFLRGRKDYALFHSSVAHMKPPSSGRWVIVVAPLMAVGAAYALTHQLAGYVKGGKGAKPPAAAASSVAPGGLGAPGQAGQVASVSRSGWADVPKLSGCYAVDDKCTCQASDGRVVRIEYAMCKLSSQGFDGLVEWERNKSKRYEERAPHVDASASAPQSPAKALPLL